MGLPMRNLWPLLKSEVGVFFKYMGGFSKKEEKQDPTKPLEAAEEKKTERVEPTEDRSMYNCDVCKGEGLTYHIGMNRYERCTKCGGTGKIN